MSYTLVSLVENSILNLIFADADIKEELKSATKLKDPDEAKWALEQAQEQIDSLLELHHPLAYSIAAHRQAELDAIKHTPWTQKVFFNGKTLCLGNYPEIPWEWYPITDGEKAWAGMLPTQNRKGLRLRRQRRQYPGPSILRIMG